MANGDQDGERFPFPPKTKRFPKAGYQGAGSLLTAGRFCSYFHVTFVYHPHFTDEGSEAESGLTLPWIKLELEAVGGLAYPGWVWPHPEPDGHVVLQEAHSIQVSLQSNQ